MRIKKTLVTVTSTKTGRHTFLVAAEVDDKGTARISFQQWKDLIKLAGIQNDETFSFN